MDHPVVSGALIAGSSAMARREPGQVRKEAAISEAGHVPEDRLAGALGVIRTHLQRFEAERTALFFIADLGLRNSDCSFVGVSAEIE